LILLVCCNTGHNLKGALGQTKIERKLFSREEKRDATPLHKNSNSQ
jgi:hypothetical protein